MFVVVCEEFVFVVCSFASVVRQVLGEAREGAGGGRCMKVPGEVGACCIEGRSTCCRGAWLMDTTSSGPSLQHRGARGWHGRGPTEKTMANSLHAKQGVNSLTPHPWFCCREV